MTISGCLVLNGQGIKPVTEAKMPWKDIILIMLPAYRYPPFCQLCGVSWPFLGRHVGSDSLWDAACTVGVGWTKLGTQSSGRVADLAQTTLEVWLSSFMMGSGPEERRGRFYCKSNQVPWVLWFLCFFIPVLPGMGGHIGNRLSTCCSPGQIQPSLRGSCASTGTAFSESQYMITI